MNQIALPDVANIIMGQSPASSSYNTRGEGLPFFQGKTDFGDTYPAIRMYCTEPNKIAEAGDILISVRAPVGPTNIARERSCIGRGLAAIRCSDQIELKYLLYFLRHYEPQLARLGTGSTFEAISRDDLESVLVPLPPLPEQQRIAAILDRADRLRRTRRYAAQLSNSFLQALFIEMFGDVTHFDLAKFEELLREDPKNGLYLQSEKYGQGAPIIRIDAFYDGVLGDPQYLKRVNANEKEIREFSVENGDILINRVNSLEYLGKCALVKGLTEATLFESNMMRIRVNNDLVLPIYLVNFLSSAKARAQILTSAKKAVNQASINQTDVKSLTVPLPPLDLQEKFACIVQQFDRLRAQQREAERQAEQLFQALLHRAFVGEL